LGIALVTGSGGLIGSEAVRFLMDKGLSVRGIDNDMRSQFFGKEASTRWNRERLEKDFPDYKHYECDIRSEKDMERIFKEYGKDIKLIVHCAAQPSHDWAANDPFTDFTVNANGTLVLLEMTRRHCPKAVFINISTNKVYGDTPNSLPLLELETRWEIDESFRGGCLTGSGHSGTELHGFLSYVMICTLQKKPYTVFGYKGKQVRDNIHSYDLVNALYHFYQNPGVAKVYNMGGSRHSNCSMLEAIQLCEEITGNKLDWKYEEQNRIGDHIWWISDVNKFKKDYPAWDYKYDLKKLFKEIHGGLTQRI
jgi:CDP-paratose 2-epimerase